MNQAGYKNYRTANVETADQGRLILIVYDWAIRHCKLAKGKVAREDLKDRNEFLKKAQQALTELMGGLNMDAGGEISKNLYGLYEYMNRRLVEANIKKDDEPVDEVLGYLGELRKAWVEAIDKERKPKAGLGGPEAAGGLAMVG